jgi:hypothetical protein
MTTEDVSVASIPGGLMISLLLFIVFACVLAAEYWTGIAVVSWTGDQMTVERAKHPGPYWYTMALHTFVGVGLPTLAFFAT